MKARRGVRCVCVLGHGGSQGGSARIPLLTPALPCPPGQSRRAVFLVPPSARKHPPGLVLRAAGRYPQ